MANIVINGSSQNTIQGNNITYGPAQGNRYVDSSPCTITIAANHGLQTLVVTTDISTRMNINGPVTPSAGDTPINSAIENYICVTGSGQLLCNFL